MYVCRDPFSEFLWAHCDSGHRPRFSSLLWHPGPEIPGEPFGSSWWLPEVPRRWHPQAHYRERLAGTQFSFFLSFCLQWNWSWPDVIALYLEINCHFKIFLLFSPIPSLSLSDSSTLLSESRWDVEELLFRHSFLPQRGVHPLLWRFWHQAVCSRWTALFWPAWQLRRTVELVCSFPPLLHHYVLVQIFT